jgi:ABC-type polysaccharide transport system permease subunit
VDEKSRGIITIMAKTHNISLSSQKVAPVNPARLADNELKRELKKIFRVPWKKDFKENYIIYLLLLPIFTYFIIFSYLPMFGIVMSFQDFKLSQGIFGSEWVGLENFRQLFSGSEFGIAIKNTVIIGLFNLFLGFPAPIVFAFIIHSIRFKKIRRGIQTISYMPNFVAAVVVANILISFLATDGAITRFLMLFGMEEQNLLANPNPPVFWVIYALRGVWQGFGFGSIIYMAMLSNISKDLYEAAAIDGVGRFGCMFKISLPQILPVIMMFLTIQIGVVFRAGFDGILLFPYQSVLEVSDTLFTYTFRMAFGSYPDYGLSAASSLFQSVIGTVMLVGSNIVSKKTTNFSLF